MTRHAHRDYVLKIEAVLKEIGTPYVAVDDARKAVFSGAKIDSFDLLIYVPQGDHLLATVLPPSRPAPTQRQRDTLVQWQRVFGSGFAGAFIHACDDPTVQLDGKGPGQPLRSYLRPNQSDKPLNEKEHICPTSEQEVSSGSGWAL